MKVSIRYKELCARVSELRKHFLPRNFSSTGNYTDLQVDRAKGYRILVHAEIESYLEDVATDTIRHALGKWKTTKEPSLPIFALLASYHSSWNVKDDTSNQEIIDLAKSRNNIKDSINEIINLAQTKYTQIIVDNHGIRRNNLKSLILPIGVDIKDLDETWLVNLDEFGKQRGFVAHNSKKTTGQINPKDELIKVKSLLSGLKELDILILKQKK